MKGRRRLLLPAVTNADMSLLLKLSTVFIYLLPPNVRDRTNGEPKISKKRKCDKPEAKRPGMFHSAILGRTRVISEQFIAAEGGDAGRITYIVLDIHCTSSTISREE